MSTPRTPRTGAEAAGGEAADAGRPVALRFGVFELDLRNGELRKSGLRVRIQRQPFKLLAVLAGRAGALVTREDLRAELWGADTFVDFDQGLNFCIKQIRAALGDDPQAPRFVETLPRQGYRFVAPVTVAGPVLRLVRPGSTAELPAPAPPERSVAVLPFEDKGHEKDLGYLCEGIAEEILLTLRRVERLRVASRACSFRFAGSSLDPREIGRELGVAHLLTGNVRRAAERLRITVELLDVSDGFQVWADRYDRQLSDIFSVQEEIARTVTRALEITLSAQESGALGHAPTRDPGAYDCYLRGRKHYYEYDRRGVELALEHFGRAVERDPGYARAYAGLSDCHAYLFMNGGRSPSNLAHAVDAARQALHLDAGLAEAHASLGTALSLCGRHEEAERAFEAAIRVDPRLFEAHYFYARDCFARGLAEPAIRHYEEAARARPHDYQVPLLMAQVYDDLGRPEEAAAARRRGVAIATERLATSPGDVRALYMGANGLVALGDRERGLEWADRALALRPGEPMLLYNVACIRCLAGDLDGALRDLERSVEAGFTGRDWLEHDSNLAPVRDSARFRAILERMSQVGAAAGPGERG